MKASREFTDPEAAKTFGLALRKRGIEPGVRVIEPVPAITTEWPDSAAAEAEIAAFAEKGERLGVEALSWAKSSQWADGRSLAGIVECLASDLEDGHSNGAASREQAARFIARLEAALNRAPKTTRVLRPEQPRKWVIVWDEPESGDTDGEWGTSVGSDGWLCD